MTDLMANIIDRIPINTAPAGVMETSAICGNDKIPMIDEKRPIQFTAESQAASFDISRFFMADNPPAKEAIAIHPHPKMANGPKK